MVRPREFDRDAALATATRLFWAKGFAATSTDDLLKAMGIGRQSMYNAFGDKRQLYLEVLQTYQQNVLAGHLKRLNAAASPLDGMRELLRGLIADDDGQQALGCLGVCAVGEFGTTDAEILDMAHRVAVTLGARIVERIREAQEIGEIDPAADPAQAAAFIQTTMAGLQVAARAGAGREALHTLAEFAVGRLKAV